MRPKNRQLSPVQLDAALDEIFNKHQPPGQDAPLMRDDQNEGYIHAPSVNHAVTAAVLRNGYVANATPAQPELLKVNLSSERVRRALGMIEGIRNGQSLGALLGYQLERGLHDRHQFAECDQFIYALRLVFPLYIVPAEELPAGTTIESIQARNVVNGLNLVRHVKNAAPADQTYPFGFPNTQLPDASAAQKTAINAEIDRLLDIHDALADLAVAEGVHQVVMGNYDRAAATHGCLWAGDVSADTGGSARRRAAVLRSRIVWGCSSRPMLPLLAGDNPRVKAEPAINRWVGKVLPPPARVACTVKYRDAVTGTVTVHVRDAGRSRSAAARSAVHHGSGQSRRRARSSKTVSATSCCAMRRCRCGRICWWRLRTRRASRTTSRSWPLRRSSAACAHCCCIHGHCAPPTWRCRQRRKPRPAQQTSSRARAWTSCPPRSPANAHQRSPP